MAKPRFHPSSAATDTVRPGSASGATASQILLFGAEFTKAYAARFAALGGVILSGNAGSLHRADGRWRIETETGALDATEAVLALGPFAPDVLRPLGIRLPLGIKRGYHLHFRTRGNAATS